MFNPDITKIQINDEEETRASEYDLGVERLPEGAAHAVTMPEGSLVRIVRSQFIQFLSVQFIKLFFCLNNIGN